MVEVKNIEVFNLERAQRAIQNSYKIHADTLTGEIKPKLSKALGNDMRPKESHDAYLAGILVTFDLTYDAVFIQELMRYHFIDFVMSTSKQHSLDKFMTAESFNPFNQYVDSRVVDIVREKYNKWVEAKKEKEKLRYEFQAQDLAAQKENEKKCQKNVENAYYELIFNLPHGFQLEGTMTTNYRQLKTIVVQRWRHKMHCDWDTFIKACYSMPQFRELCGFEDKKWDL